MRNTFWYPLVVAIALSVVLSGCGAPHCPYEPSAITDVERNRLRAELLIFDGSVGERVEWDDVISAAIVSDVVIFGEQHDNAVGHAMQLAVYEDILAFSPNTALSMEMFDRTQQASVDDYLTGLITVEQLCARTDSSRWPDWMNNYQPLVDAAMESGASVIAANTPWGRYLSVARKEGYERLDDLTPAQKALFETPDALPTGKYRERFWEIMAHRPERKTPDSSESDETPNEKGDVVVAEETGDGSPPPEKDVAAGEETEENLDDGPSDEEILGFFRSQLVMDTTMADSIADALHGGADKVMHLVGCVHCDFEGGTVLQLRRLAPNARILVITMVATDETEFREEDEDRADFVIYTGEYD